MRTSSTRLTLYLFCGLLGLVLSSLMPHPLLGEAVLLLFCVLPTLYERARGETVFLGARPRRVLSSLLFFPLLLGVTVGLSALTSLLFPALTPDAPTFTPLALLTSALAPALAEETLFRLLALSLLLPYGKGRAICFSALLFALFHQSLYQMPYAFGAGLVLAAAALYSDSFLLPVLLHFVNNLLSLLIGKYLTLPLVLLFVLLGVVAAAALFLPGRKETRVSDRPTEKVRTLFPLLLYAVYCLTMAVFRLLG